MRWTIWLLLVFIIAIAAAFAATTFSGTTVTFSMLEQKYELSFIVFSIMAALAFAALYFAIRLLVGIVQVPERTRKWNLIRGERNSHKRLNQATLQYFAGRYSRSLKNVNKALKFYDKKGHLLHHAGGTHEFGVLANLLAAANENTLGNKDNSMAMLQLAIQNAKASNVSEAPDGLQLLQIEWFIKHNQPEAARAALKQLDPGVARRIAALQLQLEVDRMENQPQQALKTVKLLAKHKAYAPEQANLVIVESACKVLEGTHSPQELQLALDALDKKDRKIPEVIAYAAKHFAILGDSASARDLIASSWNMLSEMSPETKRDLLATLDLVLVDSSTPWLERLEKSYNENPDDPMFTYLAGRICFLHGVMGRAQSLLDKAARNPALPIMLRQRAWFTIAQFAEKNGELAQANAAYKEAVELLTY